MVSASFLLSVVCFLYPWGRDGVGGSLVNDSCRLLCPSALVRRNRHRNYRTNKGFPTSFLSGVYNKPQYLAEVWSDGAPLLFKHGPRSDGRKSALLRAVGERQTDTSDPTPKPHVKTAFVGEAYIPVEASEFADLSFRERRPKEGLDTPLAEMLCFLSYTHFEPGRAFDILAVMHPNLRKQLLRQAGSPDGLQKSNPPPDVPVRVHDQCLTGEVFRSLRCDCREQLGQGLAQVWNEGSILLYLQQEGRGIGLANKIAAYSLQENGLDTVDANRALGYADDLRTYSSVKFILDHLGIGSIQLMTNNPRKIRLLEETGVRISKIVPIQSRPNPHNLHYLRTKVKRMAHVWNEADLGGTGTDVNSGAPPLSHETENGDTGSVAQYTPEEGKSNFLKQTAYALAAAAEGKIGPSLCTTSGRTSSSSAGKRPRLRGPPGAQRIGGDVGSQRSLVAHVTSPVIHSLTESAVNMRAAINRSQTSPFRWSMGRESVAKAVDRLREGGMILVTDDANRENEGDIIASAAHTTPEMIAYIVRKTSGVLCATMHGSRLDELKLPPMRTWNEDPRSTAFAISVDLNDQSTGISAASRHRTFRALSDPAATAKDFQRPGHVFPLRARPGGVLSRGGHTEASVDLLRLAGVTPSVGVIGEVVSEWDPADMARMEELQDLSATDDLPLTTIQDLRCYLLEHDFGLRVPEALSPESK